MCAYSTTMVFLGTLVATIVGDEITNEMRGRVCAFGDMNKDGYTDIILQIGDRLDINLQTENGQLVNWTTLFIGVSQPITCAVGDFNGDSRPDVMISRAVGGMYASRVFINNGSSFEPLDVRGSYFDEPMIADVNGDGVSDIIGFAYDEKNRLKFHCLRGTKGTSALFFDCSCLFGGINEKPLKPIHGFPHFFADIDGDLSAELVFGMEGSTGGARLDVWKRTDVLYWQNQNDTVVGSIPFDVQYVGGAVVGDFDGDAAMDILLPVCRDELCRHVDRILWWSKGQNWTQIKFDLHGNEIVSEEGSKVLFRVGDFNLDGYPDLVAVVRTPNGTSRPVLFENKLVSNKRTFDLTDVIHEQNQNLRGTVTMASFFDLEEDSCLDVLLERVADMEATFEFIPCQKSRDRAFLKVETFTNTCYKDCPGSENNIGSGVPWHGVCSSYVADTTPGHKVSTQCQMPQTSHRSLPLPYALFGLGQGPDSVIQLNVGAPQWTHMEQQGTELVSWVAKQYPILAEPQKILPNTRVVVVPPEYMTRNEWLHRRYLVLSRLFFPSFPIFATFILVAVSFIALLQIREEKDDRKERRAVSYRFHFDAW
uniref:FG-GAP repeat protein n=1 Tax=Steinernema glaseri TaxID=37863 RepID=A0A1I8AS62_9BILA